jgi:hypothetical protein
MRKKKLFILLNSPLPLKKTRKRKKANSLILTHQERNDILMRS